MKRTSKKTTKQRRDWYEYVTPVLGIKWGATVTLVGYTWIQSPDSIGLRATCVIVSAFVFVEWLQMAYREFKYRGQKHESN